MLRTIAVLAAFECVGAAELVGWYSQRPLFQAPYSCAAMWRSTTYEGHSNNLDISQWDSKNGKKIEDEGNYIRSPYAGVVENAWTVDDPGSAHHGANRMWIDHENGWKSYMEHMKVSSEFIKGDRVAQGEAIGITGTTGKSSGPHIHAGQHGLNFLTNSYVNMRHMYNGVLVDTHSGDVDATTKILSANCAGEKFATWNSGGSKYVLIYSPSTGLMKIVRLAADGKGYTTTLTRNWSLQWTNIEAFTLGGQHYFVLYKQRTGRIYFARIADDGSTYYKAADGTWGTGWTHIVPFTSGSYAYLLVYSSFTGAAAWERVNPGAVFTTNLHTESWIRGRTLIQPFHRTSQYMVLYCGGNGLAKIFKVDFTYSSVTTTQKHVSTWELNWTHFVDYNVGASAQYSYLLAYNQDSGKVKIFNYNYGGYGVTEKWASTWQKTWTHITGFYIGTTGHLLMYRTTTGAVQTLEMAAYGLGYVSKLWTSGWSIGWN